MDGTKVEKASRGSDRGKSLRVIPLGFRDISVVQSKGRGDKKQLPTKPDHRIKN